MGHYRFGVGSSDLTSYVGIADYLRMKALSVNDLIEMAGGIIPLSLRLGVARTTIHDWKRLGVIPGMRIAQISSEMGVPAADLLPLVQGPRPAKVAA
jgi:hypothetical protein